MKREYTFDNDDPGAAPKPREQAGRSMGDLPVICTLTPDTIATRKTGLLPGIVRLAESREDIANGIRLRFPADVWSALAATIEAERQCCRFLRFEITVEPDGGPIWLSLSGPPGTHEFLTALIEL